MVGDEAVQGETRCSRHDERKNQNRDKSFIHVVPPGRLRLYMILRGGGSSAANHGKEAACAQIVPKGAVIVCLAGLGCAALLALPDRITVAEMVIK